MCRETYRRRGAPSCGKSPPRSPELSLSRRIAEKLRGKWLTEDPSVEISRPRRKASAVLDHLAINHP